MNWGQFKDPVSHMCLAGIVAAIWSLTQELVDLSPLMQNIFVTKFTEFRNSNRISKGLFTLSISDVVSVSNAKIFNGTQCHCIANAKSSV